MLKETVTGLERERDFYFSKLRDIELLIQQAVEAPPATPSPRSRLIGLLRFPGQPGADPVTIGRVGGHALAPGLYTATVYVSGSSAGTRSVRFRVRA